MLSIGKLDVGQADYYLEQAQGSVTRAGTWVGDGTRALGLGGTVDALRFDRVLSGCALVRGEPLGRVVPRRVPGFDLTFSAPKSVSVLFGVGDDGMRAAIQDAHDPGRPGSAQVRRARGRGDAARGRRGGGDRRA